MIIFPGENLKVAGKENAVKDVCLALSTHKVSPDVCEAAAAALVSLLLDGEFSLVAYVVYPSFNTSVINFKNNIH